MGNTFLKNLKTVNNYTLTENGGLAHKSTNSAVYDMFATGGAYRNRSDADCILLFKNALEENAELALRCLFYLGDCRGGQGERRFFRVCFKWLANNYGDIARLISFIPEYRRYDDILYACVGTPIETAALDFIKHQLALDIECKTPSLLAKWLPSENAHAQETKHLAGIVRNYLGLDHKEYRKMLSALRTRINVLEKLMSENRWAEIEFDKIPSKAGLIYKNAFARRDIIAKKYEAFAKSKDTKVNAEVLYPYEIVSRVRLQYSHGSWFNREMEVANNATDRAMLEKYWNNLPNYCGDGNNSMLCVVDTSGSMTGESASAPINVAISLGMYAAERLNGPFKDHYISFSSRPQLIKIEGVDFADKVRRIYQTNLCENTNLEATFDMLLNVAKKSNPEDIPNTICVISDMQIDYGSEMRYKDKILTTMETMRLKWARAGLKMPKLVYWNVDARGNANILDDGPNVSYVSGFSPVIYESILSGKTGYDLMLDKLNSARYSQIHA